MNKPELDRRRLIATLGSGLTMGIAGCQTTDSTPTATEGADQTPGDTSTPEPGSRVEVDFMGWSTDLSPLYNEMGKLVVEQWKKLGFDVNAEYATFNVILENVDDKHQNYQSATWGYSGNPERADPSFWTYLTLHSSQAKRGTQNVTEYQNPEYDEHAEAQFQFYDRDKRQEEVYACQKIWSQDQPYHPAYGRATYGIFNTNKIDPDTVVPMVGGLLNVYNLTNIETEDNVLRWTSSGEFKTINPVGTSQALDRRWIVLAYDRLAQVDAREGIKTDPWAAKTIQKEDDTTFLVEIHEDMTFTDGEPVTAEDIKFSYEFQKEHSTVIGQFIQEVESIERLDEYSLRFNLTEPYAPFKLQALTMPNIIPKHIWTDIPDGTSPTEWVNTEEMTVTSGPFQLTEFSRGEQVIYEANKEHHKRPPNIDRLVRVVATNQASLRLLESRDADVFDPTPMASPSEVGRLEQNNDHLQTYNGSTLGIHTMVYNTKVEPVNDKAVRRALTYAIPKQQIKDIIYEGFGSVPQSFMKESAFPFYYNPDVDKFNLDIEKGKQELRDAGYEYDDDGNLRYPS